MKIFEKIVAKLLVKIVWFFTFLLPVNDRKVTFISCYSNKLKGDFKLVSKELEKRGDYKQVFLLRRFRGSLKEKFIYLLNYIPQTYHLNTSKVVIIDSNNFPISNCRKKSKTTVIQLWHACGAIKKFGYDVSRKYEIRNYDYIFAAGKECKSIFSRAFNMEEDKILTTGVAQTDFLFDKVKLNRLRNGILKDFPQIKGKKVVLYAPTFRGDGAVNTEYVDIDLEKIQKKLGEEYVIMYKLHPSLIGTSLCNNEKVINVNSRDLYRVFSVTDILITDYSSIVFDFSILEKPMVFYTPDLEEYKKERGFYYDYEGFVPGPVCMNEEAVIEAIKNNNFNMDKVRKLREEFFEYKDGESTIRIVDHIEGILADDLQIGGRLRQSGTVRE
jgi:CDP-glycerol glycerophosphotransferase (TagB/SpsB family)